MARFILVAGSWHGAWCWEYVIPLLEQLGHRAEAVELPGMGADRTPFAGLGMTAWAQSVANVIEADPEPVILVGHSRGGAVISQVAELVPDRIRLSVYLAAILIKDGEAAMQASALVAGSAASPPQFPVTEDGLALQVGPGLMEYAYQHSTPELLARASDLITPEPVFALMTPLSLSDERYGRVPRAYVECLDDKVVSLELQRAMLAREPCQYLRSIDTDHCPTYSAPELLAQTLDELVAAASR